MDLSTLRGDARALLSIVEREALKRARREFPDPDDATVNMLRSSLREGPLRLLVTMGGGTVSFAVIDRVIDMINHRWPSLLGRLRRTSAGIRR